MQFDVVVELFRSRNIFIWFWSTMLGMIVSVHILHLHQFERDKPAAWSFLVSGINFSWNHDIYQLRWLLDIEFAWMYACECVCVDNRIRCQQKENIRSHTFDSSNHFIQPMYQISAFQLLFIAIICHWLSTIIWFTRTMLVCDFGITWSMQRTHNFLPRC